MSRFCSIPLATQNISIMSAVMEDLLARNKKLNYLKRIPIISGTIMEIRPTEVVIDFGGKAEGTEIPAHEFLD